LTHDYGYYLDYPKDNMLTSKVGLKEKHNPNFLECFASFKMEANHDHKQEETTIKWEEEGEGKTFVSTLEVEPM
jgi:hypothetical protein